MPVPLWLIRGRDMYNERIDCPLFQKQEPLMLELANKINTAKGIRNKAKFVKELQKEVGVLLSCHNYKEKDSNCKNCRFVANLRQRISELMIKAKKCA